MQCIIVCSNCADIIPWTVPELTADVWRSNCPACSSVTELKETFGRAEESPSFAATDEHLLKLPPLMESNP